MGSRSEALACSYLKARGYQILATNYRGPLGEIDIIAQKRETIIFVEVKARRSLGRGLPEEAVTLEKQKRICRMALKWLKEQRRLENLVRFDVITIIWGKDGPSLRHLKNAFGDALND